MQMAPANVPNGHYPGENCEPEGVPVQFNYGMYRFRFIVLSDRIYQMFENHREWRTICLNRDHPKNLFPSYLGDSIAKCDDNTLIVGKRSYAPTHRLPDDREACTPARWQWSSEP